MRRPGEGAARDVAHGVAAGARGRQAGGVEAREDVRQRREPEVVELDRLPRAELARVGAVLDGELADGAQLVRLDAPGRELDPEHERADLRLVVVEAPPLEPDDVLLRDVRVARRDQRRQLAEHPERALLALEALDGVPLEDELERRRLRCPGGACGGCHVLSSRPRRPCRPRSASGPGVGGSRSLRWACRGGRRVCHLPASTAPGRAAHGWSSHLTGSKAPVAAASSGQIPRPLVMTNASQSIATSLHSRK